MAFRRNFKAPALSGARALDALLPAGVAAIGLALAHRAPLGVFVLAALGLVPLAAVLGRASQRLAAQQGPLAAGLLQATLGNASELILGLIALQAGLVDVVKASLTGSIISNLLLVMGLALLAGGRGREKQCINRSVASTQTTMLFLAAAGLIVPAVFSLSRYGPLGGQPQVVERLSLWTAVILIAIYAVGLVYQLRASRRAPRPAPETAGARGPIAAWPLATMLMAVALIAVLSELLVGELRSAQAYFHGTDLFWGGVVFALIGNAAENVVAVAAARRDDMDLAMAIGVGSSLQIALLLAPVLVFASLALGHPMSLVFSGLEIVAVVLAAVMMAMIAMDGETNWFEGAQLLAVYAILAVAFYLSS